MLKNGFWMFAAVMIVFAMTMVGCANGDPANETNDEAGNDSEIDEPVDHENDTNEYSDESEGSIVDEERDFELIRPMKDLSEEMQDWMENSRKIQGTYRYEDSEIYLIAAGEKPTGGFRLEIVDEALENGTLTVTYKLHRPGPDDIVTQALTYPVALFEVNEGVDYDEIDVVRAE